MNNIRLITTHEGRFANIADMKQLLQDDQYVNDNIVPLLVVGRNKGHSATQIVRVVAGAILFAADKGEEIK